MVAVILNWNGWEDTIKCVESLQKVTYSHVTIVLVDNGSTDGSVERLSKRFPEVQLLSLPNNRGYAAGNNAGIRYALNHGADYVLVLNNDTVVNPDFLSPLVEVSELRQDVGIVTGRVHYLSHREELFSGAGKISWALCTGMNKGGFFTFSRRPEEERDIDYVCGVLLLVKRAVFEQSGFFDEKYFMYFEDLEFSRRINHRFSLRYVPASLIYHKSGGGKGWRFYTETYLFYHTRNRFLVFENESVMYRLYVTAFSFVVSACKSFFVSLNFVNDPQRARRQFFSLWKGFRDGVLLYLTNKDNAAQTDLLNP